MARNLITRAILRFSHMRRQRRVQNFVTLCLVIIGPLLALATYVVLGPLENGTSDTLRMIFLLDFIYILVLATLVLGRVARMVLARRAKSAGSRLHLRLTGVFAFIAMVPTILVAVFAVLTVNAGIEGWFSERVQSVIGASLSAAEAYEEGQKRDLENDARAVARILNRERLATPLYSDGEIRQALTQLQPQIQRGLREAFVIDSAGDIRARGAQSYEFDFERPSEAQLAAALEAGVLIIEDWNNNEFRALLPLTAFLDRMLYVSREVDGQILNLLDDTQETAALYSQLEADRGQLLFDFGLIYMGFAVILILAATWAGLWFAERLSRPVGRLAGAAQRVGTGDLDVTVPAEKGDDEIAMLGRYFNQMTRQLKAQRETLMQNTAKLERRERLFNSVLSSVTSGVVGLDAKGQVTFVNKSAERLLQLDHAEKATPLAVAVPEFGELFQKLKTSHQEVTQGEVRLVRGGRQENLLVRIATRTGTDDSGEGYVIAFEDVTDLVSAQRMAAWGDVARRIAHEIKNPLTPIQLSAERIKRKFAPKVGDDSDALEQMTDVIVRQTGDLRRIVDEFSKFARMPEPERSAQDLVELVRDAVLLRDIGTEGIEVVADLPNGPCLADLDATMISQALNNLIKNAGEAIESRMKNVTVESPEVRVSMALKGKRAKITIADNGIGLPEDRMRLFEPYVTSRSEGTGLGLPIVLKIIEEHDGTLVLEDAPSFDDSGHQGAMAVISLPLKAAADDSQHKKAAE